ncbi:Regulatory protein BlaR1 [Aquisphaera giovannonii]|uniref:Regulatory protein BlaR1 n=1 Tax=Aquisphaera giovannonii TaxID=406548 RepID=A0A5B9W3C9_9BACT|nr:carboxypeptidase regulatory-like domain-containing protein [Aquisphaera giovannonii]QEH35123.1 Regulatory protein BlaR1 [Aquisphaera giovannonii]
MAMSWMTTMDLLYPGDAAATHLAAVALGAALLATAAVLAARLRWLSRRPAPRHAVLLCALAGCLAMPALAGLVAWAGLAIAVPVLPTTRAVAASEPLPNADEALAPISPLPPRPGETSRAEAAMPVGGHSDVHSPHRAAIAIVLGIWGLGTLVLLLGLTRGVRRARSLRLSARPVDDPAVTAALGRIGDDVGAGSARRLRRPRLARSPDGAGSQGARSSRGRRRITPVLVAPGLATPVAVGILRPAVILPEGLAGAVSADELRDVLVHEMAHARRRDPLVVLLQGIARALYWPIVPVHLLGRELERAREELCDNHVLRDRDAIGYGETLLHLAELATGRDAGPLVAAAGILHWRGKLETRIAGLLDAGRSTATRTPLAAILGLLALSLGAGSLAASMRLVARADEPQPSPQPPAAPTAAKPEPPDAEGRSILVKAVGPDGKPMPGVSIKADISAEPEYRGDTRFVTDGRGQVRIPLPGGISDFDLRARAEHCVPMLAHWGGVDRPSTFVFFVTRVVSINGDGTASGPVPVDGHRDSRREPLPPEFTFRMDRGSTIGGTVRDPEGRPIEGVRVEVTSFGQPEGASGRAKVDGRLAADEHAPRSDATGRWSFDGAPTGRWVFEGSTKVLPEPVLQLLPIRAGYAVGANREALHAGPGSPNAQALRGQAAVLTMRPTAVVRGTVIDPDGKPVAGAVIIPNVPPADLGVGGQAVQSDEQGRFTLPPLPSEAQALWVVGPGWMPARREIDIRPGLEPLEIRLGPGKDLRIQFVDPAGKPVPGVDVSFNIWQGGNWLYVGNQAGYPDAKIPRQADGEGRYRWPWAPADDILYTFNKEGYQLKGARITADGKEHVVVLRETPEAGRK